MKMTWRDGATTVSTAGAVLLERAYANGWNWPLVTETRWVITGLAVLFAVGFLFSYLLDSARGVTWSWIGAIIGVLAVALAGLGLYYDTATGYTSLLMFNTILFWLASITAHLSMESTNITRSHA
jgi:hypothetical protein